MRKEIEKLEEEIRRHRSLYYSEYNPEISDEKFDWLVGELIRLKPDSSVLAEIGAPPKGKKVKLPVILGSLDKVTIVNVFDWMNKQNDAVMASLKLDGVSLFAEWDKGKLKTLSTRGDGEEGEDKLFKAHKFKHLPLKISIKSAVRARGEAIVEGIVPKPYKNRRSAAIGIVGREDLKLADKISVRFYQLINYPKLAKSERKRYEQLRSLKLSTPNKFLINENDIIRRGEKVVKALIKKIEEKDKLDYDIDGIVLTRNLSNRENVLIPKNSIAFKMNADSMKTKVKEIVWQITRTGKVVPVVHIDQVEVDGVEISHPTGHNYDYLKRKGIGEGATITVVRSGDVIPYIDSVIKEKKPIKPKFCPECKTDLKQVGVNLVCTNPTCKGKMLAQLTYFLAILGVEEISTQTLDNLNLYTLKDFLEITHAKIVKTPGFRERSADIFLEERKKILRVKEEDLLIAFGIPQVGPVIAEKIIDSIYKGKFVLMFKEDKEKMRNKLLMINGIGPSVAESFVKNIGGCRRNFFLLRKHGMKFEHKKSEVSKTLAGKTFQLTGRMSHPRKEVIDSIVSHGGQIVSVTRNLDYLIQGKSSKISTKRKKVIELSIDVIDEFTLNKMIEGIS